MRDDVVVTSSYLTGEEPIKSERYHVQGIECKRAQGEFDYCTGLQRVWMTDKLLVNVEHDMEYSDELVDELIACPHPICAYAYQVFPTALGHYIYCATTVEIGNDNPALSNPHWIEEGDEWAIWSSIGFCKIDATARVKPLDRLFWQWIEHSINRVVGTYKNAGGAGWSWHIHWPSIQHHHDYEKIPDHLW